MAETWDPGASEVLRLPSGRMIRGRALRHGETEAPFPTFGVYLLGSRPPAVDWESTWVRWPDFRLPTDKAAARDVLIEAWQRSEGERVEIACFGGKGRTGTALACIAVLDGVPPDEAVAYVRANYHHHAVETPWQRRFVNRFAPG